MDVLEPAGILLHNIHGYCSPVIHIADIELYDDKLWIDAFHHYVKQLHVVQSLAEFKVVVMVTEFHSLLLTQLTAFVEYIHVTHEIIIGFSHAPVH